MTVRRAILVNWWEQKPKHRGEGARRGKRNKRYCFKSCNEHLQQSGLIEAVFQDHGGRSLTKRLGGVGGKSVETMKHPKWQLLILNNSTSVTSLNSDSLCLSPLKVFHLVSTGN